MIVERSVPPSAADIIPWRKVNCRRHLPAQCESSIRVKSFNADINDVCERFLCNVIGFACEDVSIYYA